jgi:hypothetical protein
MNDGIDIEMRLVEFEITFYRERDRDSPFPASEGSKRKECFHSKESNLG